MQQYSNCHDPTESAARKERLRHAEEQGDIEEAATRLAQSNLVTNHLEPEQVPNEETPERIPASHRLGPANEAHSAFDRLGPLVSPLERVELPRSVQTPLKRKPGRPSLRCATPLSLKQNHARWTFCFRTFSQSYRVGFSNPPSPLP